MKQGIMLLMALLLCGCSSMDGQINENHRTLTIALWDYDQVSYDRLIVEAFEEAHPNVRVKVLSYPDSYYDQKAESMILSGKQVDVIYLRTLTSLKYLCEQKMMRPLDDFIQEKDFIKERYQDLDVMQYEGNTYAVPYRRDQYVLFYNCDLFDRAGLQYPQDGMTWEEFRLTAKRLQQKIGTADTYAIMILPMNIQWIASARANPFSYSTRDIEPVIPAMRLLRQIQFEDRSSPLYGDCIAKNVQQRQFETNNFGMYVGGTWFLNYLTTDQKVGRFSFRWGVCGQPLWEGQDPDTRISIATSLGIGANAADPALAWEFIQFAAGKEGARIMAKEQMFPAYMDDEIRQIFHSNFAGVSISEDACDNQSGVCSDMPTNASIKGQQQIEQIFLSTVTGQQPLTELLQ